MIATVLAYYPYLRRAVMAMSLDRSCTLGEWFLELVPGLWSLSSG